MYDFLLVPIVTIALSCSFASYLTFSNTVTLKSCLEVTRRSLKLVSFDSLGAVSYSPSIVTMAVSVIEIFSVKEWCDLENRVRVRSRSLEMTPFVRSHIAYEFLLAFHPNYGAISYRLRDIAGYWSKIANFLCK